MASNNGNGKVETKLIKKVKLNVIKLLYAELVDNYTFDDYKQYKKYKALFSSRKERFSSGVLDWRGKRYYFKADQNDKNEQTRKFYIYELDQSAISYIDRSHKCYQKYVGFDKDFLIGNELPSSVDVAMRDGELTFFYFEIVHKNLKRTFVKNSQKVGFFYYEFASKVTKKVKSSANSNF